MNTPSSKRMELRVIRIPDRKKDHITHKGCPRCDGSKTITIPNRYGFGGLYTIRCPHYAPTFRLLTVEEVRFHDEDPFYSQ